MLGYGFLVFFVVTVDWELVLGVERGGGVRVGVGKWNEKGLFVDGKCWSFFIFCFFRLFGECGNDIDCVNLLIFDFFVFVSFYREILVEIDREF